MLFNQTPKYPLVIVANVLSIGMEPKYRDRLNISLTLRDFYATITNEQIISLAIGSFEGDVYVNSIERDGREVQLDIREVQNDA